MMELNPAMKSGWYYEKNVDGIERHTTESMAEGIRNFATTEFMSERARSRIETLQRKKRRLAGAALHALGE